MFLVKYNKKFFHYLTTVFLCLHDDRGDCKNTQEIKDFQAFGVSLLEPPQKPREKDSSPRKSLHEIEIAENCHEVSEIKGQ